MSEERVASLRNRWFTVSIGITAAIGNRVRDRLFVAPLAQPGERFRDVWDAICSAAGLVANPSSSGQITADYLTTRRSGPANARQRGRGVDRPPRARCTMLRGLSDANSPNLAGQYPTRSTKSSSISRPARASAVIAPTVADLTDADLRDLAAFYAYLPRPTDSSADNPPRIVASGAPLRGIAPCGACHGEVGAKAGAAWLEGQPVVYLRTQLEAFANSTRHNDINEQMRNIARAITPQEIDAASRYYAEHP
jgi:cytochrome c553